MIGFSCSECGAGIRVGDDSAGRQGECPQCRTILTIPMPTGSQTTAIQPTAPPAGGSTMAKVVLGLVLSTISTVVVIVYLLMPTVVKVRTSAQRASCLAKLRTIGVGVQQYAEDNKGATPDDVSDYVYLAPANGTRADDATIIACDRKGNHTGGRCVLFVNGMAQWLTDRQFDAELAQNRNSELAECLRDIEAESARSPAPPRRPSWPSEEM